MDNIWSTVIEYLNLNPSADITGATLFVTLAGVGACVGILTGLFGVGGGFLNVPILSIIFGVDKITAIASSVCLIVGTSTAGLGKHLRKGNIDFQIATILAGGSMVGAVVGDYLQDWLIDVVAGGDKKIFNPIMNALYILLLLVTAFLVWKGKPESSTKESFLQKIKLGPAITIKSTGMQNVSLIGLISLSIMIGMTASIFGVGGGILFVPVMILLIGMPTHKAVGTSILLVLLTAAVSTMKKGSAGKVSLPIVMSLLVGSSIGVQFGAHLCNKLQSKKLQKYFVFVVILAIVLVACKLIQELV